MRVAWLILGLTAGCQAFDESPADRGGRAGVALAPPTAPVAALPAGPARGEFTPVGVTRPAKSAMTIDIRAPLRATPGEPFLCAVELANPTGRESPAAVVTLTVPPPATAEQFSAAPQAQSNGKATFAFDRLPPQSERTVTFRVRADAADRLTLRGEATGDDGSVAVQTAAVDLGAARLEIEVPPLPTLAPGEVVRLPVTVRNVGSAAAESVSLFATLPDGDRPLEVQLGPIPVGGKREKAIEFTPRAEGVWRVQLDALEGGRVVKHEVRGETRARRDRAPAGAVTAAENTPPPSLPPPPPGQPALEVEWLRAPITLGTRETLASVVRVRNRGTGPAERVEVTVQGERVELGRGRGPDGVTARTAGAGLLFSPLDRLEAGAAVEYRFDVVGGEFGPGRLTATATARHQPLPLRDERNLRVVRR